MSFELPKLTYEYPALEPNIDARTMEIHHSKHHQAYVTNLNNALAGTDAENLSIEEICKNISKYPMPVRNNGGGHFNHSFFWKIIGPNAGGSPSGKLLDAINADLGGMDKFKEEQLSLEETAKKYKPISEYQNKLNFVSLPYEKTAIQSDVTLKEKRERWHENLSKDIYVEEALNVLDDLQSKPIVKGLESLKKKTIKS